MENLADYYSADYDKVLEEIYGAMYHENGFDFKAIPILTAEQPKELLMYNWGLIPWWVKSLPDGLKLRVQTLNCISAEMFTKPSYRDSAKEGKRCLIPCTGFYEWKWDNPDDKKSDKKPHRIFLNDQPLFSIGGLYSNWKDKAGDSATYNTYTVLTTKANSKMENIHNTKKRQPVIIPRQYEKDWLNPDLTEQDVLALCQPIESGKMEAYTISKLITSKAKGASDVPEVLEKFEYQPTTLF
jgi:putative SOS response-associated peptidase YedK